MTWRWSPPAPTAPPLTSSPGTPPDGRSRLAVFDAEQTAGVGQARNRVTEAVERTVPFGFCCLGLAVVWYAVAGDTPDVVAQRRRRAPWYACKTTPSVADTLATLRRVLIAAEFRPQHLTGPHTKKSPPYAWPEHKPPHNRETQVPSVPPLTLTSWV